MEDADLNRIRQAVFQLINIQSAEEKAIDALTKITQELHKLEFEIIPELMHELGVQKIVLDDSINLEVKPFYRAAIPVERRNEAFDWLRANGFGDLIKREISVKFPRGQDDAATALIRAIVEQGWAYQDSEQVNKSTLGAWLREQFERGNANLPLEKLGGFIGERCVLKIKGE
jgi:hypothetical protein